MKYCTGLLKWTTPGRTGGRDSPLLYTPTGSHLLLRSPHLHLVNCSEEAVRHLVNCSEEEDYNANIADLKEALHSRGYPKDLMPLAPYDEQKRERYLRKFSTRGKHSIAPRRQERERVLVFKAQYTQQTRRLGLRRRIETLLSDLRVNIGDDFLQNARILIAHPGCRRIEIFSRALMR